jgi:hypothetical protein
VIKLLFRVVYRIPLLVLAAAGLLVFLAITAAAAPIDSTAANIATAIIVISPFVLPMILKVVPLDGAKMTLLTYATSVVVAVIAGLVNGLFSPTNLSTAPGVLAVGTAVFGAMQLVYGLLKNSKTFGGLVT